jgi:hypothetical protein
VSGKEDKHDMAKTTRKTGNDTTGAKPAARRKTATVPAAGAGKATTRRRIKTEAEIASANDRPARADRPVAAAPVPEPMHDQIAMRAYHIFLRRGATPGHAAADWFLARAELLQARGLKA